MSDYPLTLTPEFRGSITRVTWDSRDKGPTIVTVWIGDLPVFTYPTGLILSPYDTLSFTLEGQRWEAEDINPNRPSKPSPSLRRRFSKWLNS